MRRSSLVLFAVAGLMAAAPTAPTVPAAALPSTHFDVKAATDAWLASMPATARAKSDAYFEGGYWLILWDFLFTVGTAWLILDTGWSARMRDFATRLTRSRLLQPVLFWAEFTVVTAILTLPLTIYEGYFREHQYGLSNQGFGSWAGDQLKGLLLTLIIGGLVFAAIMAIVRRAPRTWHIWGIVAGVVFSAIGIILFPVLVAPVFNTYTPLKDVRIKEQILSMAHANGIPANDVYEVNASRQSKRVSANVSGLFGTDRITLNDNLLNRCSPQAIRAVMGHEMGHYVLHHIYSTLLFSALTLAIMFGVLRWALNRGLAWRGERWGVRSVQDVAVLPLAVIVLSVLGFLFTPISNTWTRTQEFEADIFGLNASREPDGEAEADMLLGEYRKLDPSPLEEFLLYDHPSGRTRLTAAMRWKAENLCLFDASLKCGNATEGQGQR